MTRRSGALPALLIVLGANAAGAAPPVYRCGNSYTDHPCPAARTVEVADEPGTGDRHAALRVAAAERALGTALERDRLARERAARPSSPARLDRAPEPAPTASIVKRKPRLPRDGRLDPQDFISTTPAPPKKHS